MVVVVVVVVVVDGDGDGDDPRRWPILATSRLFDPRDQASTDDTRRCELRRCCNC